MMGLGHPPAALSKPLRLKMMFTSPSSRSRCFVAWETASACPHTRRDNRDEPRPAESLQQAIPVFPSATITFLVTDMEGSTELWEQAQAAWRPETVEQLGLV